VQLVKAGLLRTHNGRDDADVPFPYLAGVRLPDQAQFDPMPFEDTMIRELDDRGGRLIGALRTGR
jgi:hypothetical protein